MNKLDKISTEIFYTKEIKYKLRYETFILKPGKKWDKIDKVNKVDKFHKFEFTIKN